MYHFFFFYITLHNILSILQYLRLWVVPLIRDKGYLSFLSTWLKQAPLSRLIQGFLSFPKAGPSILIQFMDFRSIDWLWLRFSCTLWLMRSAMRLWFMAVIAKLRIFMTFWLSSYKFSVNERYNFFRIINIVSANPQ